MTCKSAKSVRSKKKVLIHLLDVVLIPWRNGISPNARVGAWQVNRQASGRSNSLRVDGATLRVISCEAFIACSGRFGVAINCCA